MNMKKYTILIPIYNDRESLTELIESINEQLNKVNVEVSILVINDASSQQIIDTYSKLENIETKNSFYDGYIGRISFRYQFNNDLLTNENLILFVFIVISSLTLPHVFIMKDFVKDK